MYSKIKEVLIKWLTHEAPYEGMPLCDFERIRYEVRPCDVLLVEGRSRVSDVIKQVTQSPWTHSCIYIGRLHDVDDIRLRQIITEHYQGEPDEQLVIEGYLGKGTIVTPLNVYREDHIRICRPRGLSRVDAQEVIKYAISRLGTDYDVRQIFDLWRFMVPWSILPRRYRSSLFESSNNIEARTVCSSMIAEAFGMVNFPILPIVRKHEESGLELVKSNPRLITPKDFDYSPYFDIIKYPFLEFGERGFYHDLPWSKEKDATPEELIDEENSNDYGPQTESLIKRKTLDKINRIKALSSQVLTKTLKKAGRKKANDLSNKEY